MIKASSTPSGDMGTAPGLRVLVAEPDSAHRAYVLDGLKDQGFAITLTADGQEALAALRSGGHDIALISLDLPRLDGVGLIKALREQEGLADLPVAVVVHREELAAIDQAFAAGATAFVSRPFHFKALGHQLRFILRSAAQAAELRRARNLAQEADSFKSNMLRLLQHELRTPLSAIVGFSEEIARAPASRYSAEFAGEVVKAGRQLNRQFSALFSSAQVIAGDVSWDFDPLTAQDLMAAIQAGEAETASARNITIRYGLDCPDAVIEVDSRYFVDAVRHIVRNAIVHGAPDGGTVDVVAAAQRSQAGADRLTIAVRDSGPGIPREKLARCLAPFGQGEDALTRVEHGFGLGLPFARKVIEAHNGVMRIASPQTGGCVVTISLPAAIPEAARGAAA
jgi:signal transduction histidine kinase